MIYNLAYTLADYIDIALVYNIILKKKLKKKKAIWMITLVIILIMQLISAIKYDLKYVNMISLIGGISIPCLLLQGKKKNNLLLYIPVCAGIYIVDKLNELFIDLLDVYFNKNVILGAINTEKNADIPLSVLLLKLNVLFIICIIYMIQNNKKQLEQKSIINIITDIRQYFILLFGYISYCSLIMFVRMLGVVIENRETLNGMEVEAFYSIRAEKTTVLWIGTSIVLILLCVWQMLTMKKEEEYRWQNESYAEYMKMQENSIREIIEKDKNMRKFRHDMYAHITALESISARIGDEQLQKYIYQMREKSIKYSVKNYSGITAVDAVVSEIEERAKEFHISIQWKGSLKGSNKIEIFDLCTVFSNLLINAVEACKNLEEKERIIYIKTSCFERSIFIDVGNHCKEKVIIEEDGTIVTEKNDKKNHGFGTKNVADTVKRNGGNIEYITEKRWFEVKIVM